MTNGVLDPDYNRDVQTKLTPAFQPGDVYTGVVMTALGLMSDQFQQGMSSPKDVASEATLAARAASRAA